MSSPPFTADEFLDLFGIYNNAIWPVQVIAYVLGGLVVALAVKRTAVSGRVIGSVLALYWLFIGIVYNLVFFTGINSMAYVFGAAFIVQGVIFLVVSAWCDRLDFEVKADTYSFAGAVLVFFSMLVYPLLGSLSGHAYPKCPVFGVSPCPTTIFTFGILLFAACKVPWFVLVIPLLWSLVGTQAAISFSMSQDYALPVAGVLGTVMIALKNRRSRGPGVTEFADSSDAAA
jgi:hypothetical protein